MTNTKSTYFFLGKLSDELGKYQIQNHPLGNNYYLEIIAYGFSIWGISDEPFDVVRAYISNIITIILSAYSFKTNSPMQVSLQHWVESKNTQSFSNMIGFFLPPYNKIDILSERSSINSPWKKAIWFYKNMSKGNSNHRLALKDYRQALLDNSEDGLLFAYRSIEDICRAVTGKRNTQDGWNEMHKILNTNFNFIKPLNEAVKKIRHGSVNDPVVEKAQKSRKQLIDIAYQIIKKEFKRTFPRF